MKNIIVIMITLILLISCSKNEKNYTVKEIDGVKVFHNKNIPSDPNFKITPKEVFTIQGYDENAKDSLRNFIHPHDVGVDSKGNIFVLDSRLSSIKKFDRNGKFIRSIGRKGDGPGEFQMAWQLMVMNDTLVVADAGGVNQFVLFDSNDDFIKKLMIENNSMLLHMTPLSSNKFISAMDTRSIKEDGTYFIFNLHLRNKKFDLLHSYISNSCKMIGPKTKVLDVVSPFIGRDDEIYIAKISTNEYVINAYDLKGNIKYRIKKDYRSIPMSEEDVTDFEESRRRSRTHVDAKSEFEDISFKQSINLKGMFVDKNGYLLVQVPLDRNKENEFDFVVDAFKDGVFINRFKMDIGKGFDYFNSDHKRWFFGDRIYHQNREDNCVTVYEY